MDYLGDLGCGVQSRILYVEPTIEPSVQCGQAKTSCIVMQLNVIPNEALNRHRYTPNFKTERLERQNPVRKHLSNNCVVTIVGSKIGAIEFAEQLALAGKLELHLSVTIWPPLPLLCDEADKLFEIMLANLAD